MAVRKDEACILSPELKDGGDEVLCGALCYLLPVTAAAGEEDEVRASIDEGCGLFGTVIQHLHQIGWEKFAFEQSSAIRAAVLEVRSEHLSTTALPAASAVMSGITAS